MVAKAQRIEARLSEEQRQKIDRAAAIVGEPLSTFLVNAATVRADELIATETTTFLPAAYFDRFLASLDEVGTAPGLDAAVVRYYKRRG